MRAFASNELIQLPYNFPADGLGAEDHPRDRSRDEQYWRDCKQRVVGKGRTEARCIVIPPGPERLREYWQDHRRVHDIRPPGPRDPCPLEWLKCAPLGLTHAVQV